ncbi:ABC-type transport system involved in cytochrome bd biosynthesis fused ATPase/permease subunit [Povalibacter uvarum]|uniref:ABC-type transport system involved in cytochrome bd biosynthesis fused ATPase/permease subunit n=1 Tax=Povalibacter uvarum TaxID=732238 RepID=A0A841HI97_9GAMM|nr:hypothetical protein [Povalibacter uvarum]MBB6092911.1 ABC-type transport system involved in cytochrome bd biosynthesis fused ATPase/permease subunit [Povalibacter uvarum]
MKRDKWFEAKWRYLRRFGPLAIAGLVVAVIGFAISAQWLVAIGFLLTVPWFLWVVLIPIYHWKDRYIGERTTLWGALLVIETSGWMKIVYWFRHVLPDRKRAGRYANVD